MATAPVTLRLWHTTWEPAAAVRMRRQHQAMRAPVPALVGAKQARATRLAPLVVRPCRRAVRTITLCCAAVAHLLGHAMFCQVQITHMPSPQARWGP